MFTPRLVILAALLAFACGGSQKVTTESSAPSDVNYASRMPQRMDLRLAIDLSAIAGIQKEDANFVDSFLEALDLAELSEALATKCGLGLDTFRSIHVAVDSGNTEVVDALAVVTTTQPVEAKCLASTSAGTASELRGIYRFTPRYESPSDRVTWMAAPQPDVLVFATLRGGLNTLLDGEQVGGQWPSTFDGGMWLSADLTRNSLLQHSVKTYGTIFGLQSVTEFAAAVRFAAPASIEAEFVLPTSEIAKRTADYLAVLRETCKGESESPMLNMICWVSDMEVAIDGRALHGKLSFERGEIPLPDRSSLEYGYFNAWRDLKRTKESATASSRDRRRRECGIDVDFDELLESVVKVDETHYRLPADAVYEYLNLPQCMLLGARAVPSMRDGKPAGFKLYAIRPSSPLAKIGFMNGDAVVSIADKKLTSTDQAVLTIRENAIYPPVKVGVIRRGEDITLTYDFDAFDTRSHLVPRYDAGAHAERVGPKGTSQVLLNRQHFADYMAQNTRTLTRGARVVPATKNGKSNGLRLYAVRPSSIFAELGLKNGDTLHSLDGRPLTADSELIDGLRHGLENAKTLVIDLTRRGKPMRFEFTIQ